MNLFEEFVNVLFDNWVSEGWVPVAFIVEAWVEVGFIEFEGEVGEEVGEADVSFEALAGGLECIFDVA